MLSQAVEEILKLYISMSKDMVPKVVKKQVKEIYLTHSEDDPEVLNFFQNLENASLKMLKSVCLYLFPFL